jgi:hypothetical protein
VPIKQLIQDEKHFKIQRAANWSIVQVKPRLNHLRNKRFSILNGTGVVLTGSIPTLK